MLRRILLESVMLIFELGGDIYKPTVTYFGGYMAEPSPVLGSDLPTNLGKLLTDARSGVFAKSGVPWLPVTEDGYAFANGMTMGILDLAMQEFADESLAMQATVIRPNESALEVQQTSAAVAWVMLGHLQQTTEDSSLIITETGLEVPFPLTPEFLVETYFWSTK